jgi:hypothetical protein
VESLAIAEIAEDIHGQIVAPVRHVLRRGPALGSIASLRANLLAEGADIGEDVAFHVLQGAVRESMGDYTALARVQSLVTRVVRVGHRMDEGVVELSLADVGLEAIYLLESRVRVERDAVGAEADNLAIFLVHAPKLNVTVSLVGMPQLMGIGKLGE